MADFSRPGPFAVAIADGEWHDASRDRHLPWRRYSPQSKGKRAMVTRVPLVIHSHGLGGSSASGADWLTHWASWGIAALAVQHPGTDTTALASDSPLALRHLLRSAVDAEQLADRQRDLLFALDQQADEGHAAIGISGHSFGAASALRLIGERRGRDDRPADPRIAAAVLFSPSARGGMLPLAERFADVAIPSLHLTGSRDNGIGPGDIVAADRCLPFTHIPDRRKYLLLLDGATHPVFAGDDGSDTTPAQRALLKAASAAFWLAHLLHDGDAGEWLSIELRSTLGTGDRLTVPGRSATR